MSGKVSIIGNGAWGKALSSALIRNHKVTETIFWRRNEENIDEHLSSDFLVLALPAIEVKKLAPHLINFKGELLISGVKGLGEGGVTVSQALAPYLSRPYVALGGPLFADDLEMNRVAGLVAAGINHESVSRVGELLGSDRVRIYYSDDPFGVEIGGVLKNIIAIAVGVASGLTLGDSCKAVLLTRGLKEMVRLGKYLGAREETLMGLSGLGDLYMTASSEKSRNFRFGMHLAAGLTPEVALSQVGGTVEGANAAPMMLRLCREGGITAPITESVVSLLERRETPHTALKKLLERPLRYE